DASGTLLTQVQQGTDFYLQMTVKDLRPDLFNRPDGNDLDTDPDENNRGVYAAYTDIHLEDNLATVAVNEVQTITVPAGGTGDFTLTYPSFLMGNGTTNAGGTTASIHFDQTTSPLRTTTAGNIASAINGLFGAGTV